eukprot:m.871129 g.871129  ORF g.871129 m.871129 type:complete len:177 (+) comp59760_c0_seq2:544-1074(+)
MGSLDEEEDIWAPATESVSDQQSLSVAALVARLQERDAQLNDFSAILKQCDDLTAQFDVKAHLAAGNTLASTTSEDQVDEVLAAGLERRAEMKRALQQKEEALDAQRALFDSQRQVGIGTRQGLFISLFPSQSKHLSPCSRMSGNHRVCSPDCQSTRNETSVQATVDARRKPAGGF